MNPEQQRLALRGTASARPAALRIRAPGFLPVRGQLAACLLLEWCQTAPVTFQKGSQGCLQCLIPRCGNFHAVHRARPGPWPHRQCPGHPRPQELRAGHGHSLATSAPRPLPSPGFTHKPAASHSGVALALVRHSQAPGSVDAPVIPKESCQALPEAPGLFFLSPAPPPRVTRPSLGTPSTSRAAVPWGIPALRNTVTLALLCFSSSKNSLHKN